jgi:hypothetical protein
MFLNQFLTYWLDGRTDLNTIVGNAENGFGMNIYKMPSSVIINGAYDLMVGTRTRP